MTHKRLREVLVVEDNEDHVELITEALRQTDCIDSIRVIRDGIEATNYLRRKGTYRHQPLTLPQLILLDLKLPRMDGFDVIRELKKRRPLKLIPIVVLSTSDHPRDIERALEYGANDFLVKPFAFAEFVAKVRGAIEYWATVSDAHRIHPV